MFNKGRLGQIVRDNAIGMKCHAIMWRLSAAVLLLLGCWASAEQPPVRPEPGIDAWSAMEIACEAVAANESWVERATFDPPVRDGDNWLVGVYRDALIIRGQRFDVVGGDRLVVIDRDGRVIGYIYGR